MKQQVIAKRYARALFALGQEQGRETLQQFGEELARLAQAMEVEPALERVFRNPLIQQEDKKAIVEKLAQKLELSRLVRNFCLFLADKNRLDRFLDIQDQFRQMLDEFEGIVRGSLITAIDLSGEKQSKVQGDLEKQLNKKLLLQFNTDQEILGGLRLRIGDKLYDASLKAQLEGVKENIKRGG